MFERVWRITYYTFILYGGVNVTAAINLFLRQNKHYNNVRVRDGDFITKCVVAWVCMRVKNKQNKWYTQTPYYTQYIGVGPWASFRWSRGAGIVGYRGYY